MTENQKTPHEPFSLSPLQIVRYYIKELHYAVKENFDDKYEEQNLSIGYPNLYGNVIERQEKADPRQWRFEVIIESRDDQSEDFPYRLRIVLVGFFIVSDDYPFERADMLARVNGPSVLYSAAREALVTVTSRTGFPSIVLPSVMFIPPSKETKTEQNAHLTHQEDSSPKKTTKARPSTQKEKVLTTKKSRKTSEQ